MHLGWAANCCIICNAPLTSSGKYTCSCFTVETKFQRSSCNTNFSIDNNFERQWDVGDPESSYRKFLASISTESDLEFLKNSDLRISNDVIPKTEMEPPSSIRTYSILPNTDIAKSTHSIYDLSPKSQSINLATTGVINKIPASNVNSEPLPCFDVSAGYHNNHTRSTNNTQSTSDHLRRSSLASVYSISPPISMYSNSIDSIDSGDIHGSSIPLFGGFYNTPNPLLSSSEFENLAPTNSQPVKSITPKAKKSPFSLYRSKSIPDSVIRSRIRTKSKSKKNLMLFRNNSSMSNHESSIDSSLDHKEASPDSKSNDRLENQTIDDADLEQCLKLDSPTAQSPVKGRLTGSGQADKLLVEIEKRSDDDNSEKWKLEEQSENNYGNGHIRKPILKPEKDFLCDTCQKEFSSKPKLRSHVLTHSNAKPFRCLYNHCQKAFARHPDLRRHMRTIHTSIENEGSRRRKCEGWSEGILVKGIEPKSGYKKGTKWGCGEEFLRMDGLTKHWKGSKMGQLCIKQFQAIFGDKGTKLSLQQCMPLAKQNVLHSRKP